MYGGFEYLLYYFLHLSTPLLLFFSHDVSRQIPECLCAGFGFVCLSTPEDATKAVTEMHLKALCEFWLFNGNKRAVDGPCNLGPAMKIYKKRYIYIYIHDMYIYGEREREIYELLVRVVFLHRGSHTRTALMQMHSATTLDWPMELVVAPLQVVKGKPLYVGLAERKEAGKRILQLKHFLYVCFCYPAWKQNGWYVWSREQITFKLVFDYPKYQEAWFGLVDWTVLVFFSDLNLGSTTTFPDPIYWIVMLCHPSIHQASIHPSIIHPSINHPSIHQSSNIII